MDNPALELGRDLVRRTGFAITLLRLQAMHDEETRPASERLEIAELHDRLICVLDMTDTPLLNKE